MVIFSPLTLVSVLSASGVTKWGGGGGGGGKEITSMQKIPLSGGIVSSFF